MKDAMRVDRPSTPPPTPYEALLGRVEVDVTHKRQAGGEGEFARVKIIFEPVDRGGGYSFHARIEGDLPAGFASGVEAGLASALRRGPKAGFAISDLTATLVDAAFHDEDSSELTFLTAAELAVVELKERGDFQVVGMKEPEPETRPSAQIIPFPKRP